MRQTTFKKEGCKKIVCANCGHCMEATIRLGEKKYRLIKCGKCKAETLYFPPRRGVNGRGEKIIFWGPKGGTWTPDHTNDDWDSVKDELTEDEIRKLAFPQGLTENEADPKIKIEIEN